MKRRTWLELTDDPRFPFMVGRLIGAAEGAAALLRDGAAASDQQQAMSAGLSAASAWFLEQGLAPDKKEMGRRPTTPT